MRQGRTLGWTCAGVAAGLAIPVLFAVVAAQEPASTPLPEPAATTAGTSLATAAPTGCSSPGQPVDVGSAWHDRAPARFTVTAGTYRLTGTRFIPPAPVPLTPADTTYALLGPGDTTPVYDRGHGTLSHQTMRLRVTKDEPAVTHLDAGRYWIVNTYGTTLTLAPCDGGTVNDVDIPHADIPGAAGVGAG